jgi:hypothetical protein
MIVGIPLGIFQYWYSLAWLVTGGQGLGTPWLLRKVIYDCNSRICAEFILNLSLSLLFATRFKGVSYLNCQSQKDYFSFYFATVYTITIYDLQTTVRTDLGSQIRKG